MQTEATVWPTCATVLAGLGAIAKSPANRAREQPFTSNYPYRRLFWRTEGRSTRSFATQLFTFYVSRIIPMTPISETSQLPARPGSPDTLTRVALVEDNAAMRRNLE